LTTTLAGLLAGLLAFGLGEALLDYFPPQNVPQTLSGAVVMRPTVQTIDVAEGKNAALTFALFGAVLGLLLGLAGSLLNPARVGRWRGPMVGALLGGVLGAVLPLLLVVPYFQFQHRVGGDDLLVPMAMHGLFWGSLGAVAGLAWGIGAGTPARARPVLLGFLGGCAAAVVYEVVGATIAPLAATTDPISKAWTTRLLGYVLVGVCTGGALGLAHAAPGRTSAPEGAGGDAAGSQPS
jgi:hypothetical protein